MPLLSSCNCYDEVTRQEQLLELRTCVYTLECFVEACVCFLAAFFLESRLSFALVAFVCLHVSVFLALQTGSSSRCNRPGVALGVADREKLSV